MTKKISKNAIATLMAIMMVIGVTLPVLASTAPNTSNDIRVFVNGQQVIFDDQQPVIINNRTMVPVRGLFEALDYDVEWLPASRTARLERRVEHYTEIHTIDIPVDGTTFTSHLWDRAPETITPEVPQQLINGRTMLPLSAITQTMEGVDARWDGPNRSVIITTGNGNVVGPTATPAPTVSPTPIPTASPTPTPSVTPTPDAWMEPFLYTQSSITLPNRRLTESERQDWVTEYNAMGGASAFELEVIRLVNEIRNEHGLPPFEICETLMMAARFYSQTIGNLELPIGHNEGPYGGSRGTVHAFGMARGIANGNAGARTPEGVIEAWRNSPTHWENILRNTSTILVGFGTHLEGQRVINYLLTGE